MVVVIFLADVKNTKTTQIRTHKRFVPHGNLIKLITNL